MFGNQIRQTEPAIWVPNGGSANGSLTVPLFTCRSRSELSSKPSLGYDYGASNGPLGFGSSLGLRQITRKTGKGGLRCRNTDESDTFILSHTEDLVSLPVKDGAEIIGRVTGQTAFQDRTAHH